MIYKSKICKYCTKEFNYISGRIFSNHVRWCDKNDTNGDKGVSNLSNAKIKRDENNLGKLIEFNVTCHKCKNIFKVTERELQFPLKENYFCNRSCANYRIHSDETKNKISKSVSISIKKLWVGGHYDHLLQTKIFSSKNERLIQQYFRSKFIDDEWTFGGHIRYNSLGITRDLYSKKLKICFEYDGIWHFKDIKGQLKNKQLKDKALEEWCVENDYRLIRISETYFQENKDTIFEELEYLFYKEKTPIIKLGSEY